MKMLYYIVPYFHMGICSGGVVWQQTREEPVLPQRKKPQIQIEIQAEADSRRQENAVQAAKQHRHNLWMPQYATRFY